MLEGLTLDQCFTVSPRYTRSIALVRDAHNPDALDGYILTPTGRDVLHRLADAVRGHSSARAWSLTGPYGSGKSAFALFAAQLLAGDERVRLRARDFLEREAPPLYNQFFGPGSPLPKRAGRLCPVLITGARQPLDQALAAGLALALRRLGARGRPPQIVEKLERLADGTARSARTAIVGLYEEANEYLAGFGSDAQGILLIVDELGKFLEYGASHPDQGDVFVLQELAEAAARAPRPFLVLTVLHQAIDRYAEHLAPSRRSEWAKVQGRFEDIAFEERSEQVMHLLANAIRQEAGRD